MLQIALPNKGALSEESVRLVTEAGYHCRRQGRELMVTDGRNGVEIYFLRPRDIGVYVSNGVLDLGITGRDLALESGVSFREVLALGFGRSTFHYAVPRGSDLKPDGFSGLRIATSYPNLVARDMSRRGIDVEVVRLAGAVEISIQLGVADAIADVVESGRTLMQAGLETVGDAIIESEAVVVARQDASGERDEALTFLKRLKGIVVARDYLMIEYDVSTDLLDRACRIAPGLESPTVSPLSREGWVAVKAMTRRRDVNRIMDELHDLGARGIIVTDIRTCRM